MDDETKDAAKQKLLKILPLIAYPNEIFNITKLDEHHEILKVDPTSLLKTILNFNWFEREQALKKFRQPVIRYDWTSYDPAAVNAYYNPSKNSIGNCYYSLDSNQ